MYWLKWQTVAFMRAAKASSNLHTCASLPELSSLDNAITNKNLMCYIEWRSKCHFNSMRAATLRLWLVFTFAHLSLCDSTKSSCAGTHCDLCAIYARIYANINLLAFSGLFCFQSVKVRKTVPMWCRLSSKLWQSCDLTNLNELKRTDSFIRKNFIYRNCTFHAERNAVYKNHNSFAI